MRNSFEWARVTNVYTRSSRHVVGRGALRGRSPRTREGRRPDRPTTVVSGQQTVVSERKDWWVAGANRRNRKNHLSPR